jgi:hypothetical protein
MLRVCRLFALRKQPFKFQVAMFRDVVLCWGVAGIALGGESLAARLEGLHVLEALGELLLLIPPLRGRFILMSMVGEKRLRVSSVKTRPNIVNQ